MKRFFQRFRDDRFALTTLQNPNVEVRTHAELVQAAQQEREYQPGAAPIAPTQALAAPNAPNSIPDSELPVIEVSTALDPDPTALAPLDSADPDSTSPDSVNPDSTDDDVQQIVDSIIADALASGGSLPSLPRLSSDDDELTAPPTPKSRRKPKSKSRRKPNRGTALPAVAGALARPARARRASAPSAASSENQDLAPDDAGPTPLERHTRKCAICNHPHREYIEEAFLQWRSPDTIKRCWELQSRTTIYHHAHAFNLFALRTRNLHLALGNIIEGADDQGFTASHILHAIRFLAHVNEDGRWTNPTHKSEVTYSMQRLPAVAGLPAGVGRPALPSALPTAESLSAHSNSEPKLIATQLLNIAAND